MGSQDLPWEVSTSRVFPLGVEKNYNSMISSIHPTRTKEECRLRTQISNIEQWSKKAQLLKSKEIALTPFLINKINIKYLIRLYSDTTARVHINRDSQFEV
eukprot:TRINITY_DN20698_c0_g2_i1.p1 TRINITY_DN20698_c0_g2~~TRINITY_DN20698_c0_g2_i1.p1  ORF type:complete len:101 (+),score=7.10 TRINITY_DN20698_c0_g2_i1:500-802(+)